MTTGQGGGVDAHAVCEAFGLGTPAGPAVYAARGELGRVHRLVTSSGVFAVKELLALVPPVEEADANVAFQEVMLAAGVALPRPRRTVDGHGIAGAVRVYEWAELSPVPEASPEVERRVAQLLARMHVAAPSSAGAVDPWYVEPVPAAAWDRLIDQGRRAGQWWVAGVGSLLGDLADTQRADHSVRNVCHLDVCPQNVFTAGPQATVMIIDWENAGPSATEQDLGSTVWDMCAGDPVRTAAFVRAYADAGGPLERLTAGTFALAAAVQAHLVEFHGGRTLDPALDAETRAMGHAGLRRILGTPLTRSAVDRMVAACRLAN